MRVVTTPLVCPGRGVKVMASALEWTMTFERVAKTGPGSASAAPAVVAPEPAEAPALTVLGDSPVVRLSSILGVPAGYVLSAPAVTRGVDIASVMVGVDPVAVGRRRERDGEAAVESIPLKTLPLYDGPGHVLRALGVSRKPRWEALGVGRALNWLVYYLVAAFPDGGVWDANFHIMCDVTVAGAPFQ